MIGYPRVVRFKGRRAGKTLFITAGLDGDEYAGIAAAYKLIEEFSYTPFNGNLIIVPIVNIPGFKAEMSQNPLDGKYPKYIYPGRNNGTPTEQLCWWVSKLAASSDFWLDMHGGALTETLEPFVGSWVSGDTKIDEFVSKVVSSISCNYASFENNPRITKTKLLARMGCGYLLTESGELGKINKNDVERHITWAHQVMSVMGMMNKKISESSKTLFHHIADYSVRHDGIWRCQYSHCDEIKKGNVIGEVYSFNNKVVETVRVKEDGKLLWLKVGSSARSGDVVAGVGTNP
jgi:predicted deacylase